MSRIPPPLAWFFHVVRKHGIAMLVAGVTAVLVTIPVWVFPLMAGDAYQGINIVPFGSDQYFYLSRAREVLEGNGMGQSLLAEGKDGADPMLTWNERLLVTPFRLLPQAFRPDIVAIYHVLDALGVVALGLLLYALALRMTRQRWVSALMPLFVIGGSTIVFTKSLLFSQINLYARTPIPWISSIVLVATLLFLYRIETQKSDQPRPWRDIVVSALLFGASFYTYLFCWTYLATFVGVLLLLSLIQKRFQASLTNLFVLGGGALIGSPALYALFRRLLAPDAREFTYFHSAVHSSAPFFSLVGAATLLLFLLYIWKQRRPRDAMFLLAIIVTGWVVLNQQVLTGLQIQPGHYYWYFIVPLGILISVRMAISFLSRRAVRISLVVLTGITLLATINGQLRSTTVFLPSRLQEQRYASALHELESDPASSVVLTSLNDTAYLVVIYTKHDLYWNGAAALSRVDADRMRQALLVNLFLNRDARRDARAFLSELASPESSGAYATAYRMLEGYLSPYDQAAYTARVAAVDPSLVPLRTNLINDLVESYEEMRNDPEQFRTLLKDAHVRYVLWDEETNPEWDLSVLPLQEIMAERGIHLYVLED